MRSIDSEERTNKGMKMKTNDLVNPFTTSIPSLGSVTEKYRFISTAEFIRDVEAFGYKLERTSAPRRGLGMHSMAFSHPTLPKVDGLDLRLLATNSHDGTSAFRLHIQVGVNLCANILVSFIPNLAANSRIVHLGYATKKVQGAIDAVRSQVDFVLGNVKAMQSRDVTPERASEFVLKAMELRDAQPYRPATFLDTQHRGQEENNAWNVFNRVQERVIKGGYKMKTKVTRLDGLTVVVPGSRAREITSIKDRVQTNYKLWQLAVETLLK